MMMVPPPRTGSPDEERRHADPYSSGNRGYPMNWVAKLRDAIQLLRIARNNIDNAIDNLVDSVVNERHRDIYAVHVAKLVEAAIAELSEVLKMLRGG